MKPILYPAGETEFRNNGLGRLSEATKCLVTEERNGQYELEMQYPITGRHYKEIVEERIIAARHDDTDDIQPLPKLQSMGNNTFYTCPAIRQIDLPSVKTIGSGQINGCRSLEVINIGPSITSINSQAFQNAPEGLVINLPVAEGVISGAPWGATSAVINYNTPYAGTVPIPEN